VKKRIPLITLLSILFIINISSQNTFDLIRNLKKEKITFKLKNNLILLPIILNGEKLTFLLDTGIKQSLLFNVTTIDSLELKNIKKVKIKGLGEEKYFDALESKNNLLRIRNIVCPDFKILVILNKKFDFSSRMGTNINGIIGSELFKDFVVKINYQRKRITFTKPEFYKYRKCRKCQEFPLTFHHQKPYINTTIIDADNKKVPVKLLIDSGSGDSLWLFEKSSPKITIPEKNFTDFLGKGLSGNIYGKKSKLNSLEIGTFKFNNLLVSYPDSTSVLNSRLTYRRNGILGSEILKRFCAIYDYGNRKITLKKNKNYKKQFYYDKSGLDIIHNGKVLVREMKSKLDYAGSDMNSDNSKSVLTYSYSYVFKNSYIVAMVKPNSVAEFAGIQKGDVILEINGTPIYTLSLQEITQKMSDKEGRTIKLLIDRRGVQYTFKFKLKDLL